MKKNRQYKDQKKKNRQYNDQKKKNRQYNDQKKKNRQYNDQKKGDKITNNDLQNITPKTKQSESRLDNGVISINLSRTFFSGIGHVLEYIDQVLKIHSF